MSADDQDEPYLWDRSPPGDSEVERLERALEPLRHRAPLDLGALPDRAPPADNVVPLRRRAPWIAAGVALVAAAAAWAFFASHAPEAPIARPDDSVSNGASAPGFPPPAPPPDPACAEGAPEGLAFEVLDGKPSCGAGPAPAHGTAPPGVWLDVPYKSRVRIAVAGLGRVDVDGGSRVRVLPSDPKEHRLELARGKVHAVIDAPPRTFFIETRSAIAIDLGCEYEIEIDDGGVGKLRVDKGFVELQKPGAEVWTSGPKRSSFVPRNAEAAIHPDTGPGVPVWTRGTDEQKELARMFDVHPQAGSSFEKLLSTLGDRDTLTLVHLLDRTEGEQRKLVLERLEAVEKPPAGSRAAILAGDAAAIAKYREQLVPRWFPKPKSP
ncbi:MAG: hypothetical protein HOV80_31605 [Polyangiaceae bacterium]|nr:hypothetical protein [Polyangiaceae bacterium]